MSAFVGDASARARSFVAKAMSGLVGTIHCSIPTARLYFEWSALSSASASSGFVVGELVPVVRMSRMSSMLSNSVSDRT